MTNNNLKNINEFLNEYAKEKNKWRNKCKKKIVKIEERGMNTYFS